jgi:hypothetical protein
MNENVLQKIGTFSNRISLFADLGGWMFCQGLESSGRW